MDKTEPKIDATSLKKIRETLQPILDTIEKDLGIRVNVGKIRYYKDGQSFDGGLSGVVVSADPIHLINWKRGFYVKHKVPKEILNLKFKYQKVEFQIVGCSRRKQKYGIHCKKLYSGSITRFNAEHIKKLLTEQI